MASPLRYKPKDKIEIDRKIRFHPKISSGEKLFYSEIEEMCKRERCHYQATELSQIFNVAPITIRAWVKNLVNQGLLDIVIDVNDEVCKTSLIPTRKK